MHYEICEVQIIIYKEEIFYIAKILIYERGLNYFSIAQFIFENVRKTLKKIVIFSCSII